MTCLIDNQAAAFATTGPAFLISAENDEQRSEVGKFTNRNVVSSISFKPEQYIGFQLSYIPEQKGVFAYLEDGVYYITVYVDNRDLALNRRIFERERNLMNVYHYQYRFDLTVLPLNGRQVDEMRPKGTKIL
jgi:hypothetical protein